MTTASSFPGSPAELDALVALAHREHLAGRLAAAEATYRKILALRPDIAEVHNDLGICLAQQGKFDLAAARFEQAIALKPGLLGTLYNLANALKDQGKLGEAAARYEQVLALRPGYFEALHNLGVVLRDQGKLDLAVARFEQVLALRPDLPEAYYNLGNALKDQGKLGEAAARYEQALALRPDYAEAINNLGVVLWQQGKLDEAAARYQHVLALRPDSAEAHNNLGNVLLSQTRFDQAAASYEQALALKPDLADALLGLAACYLVEGDYERGWAAHERRPSNPGRGPLHGLPRWTGQPLAGRSVLLLAEQGLGDTLHFFRYARLLKEQGARVVLAVQPAFGRLLASHPDVDELFILGSAAELPRSDFYLPLPSAPAAFGTTASTIPSEVPYVWANPDLLDRWRQELAAIGGFKIGIAWQGSRDYPLDRWRSIPLAQFAPLARLPGARLVSLQNGFGAEQIAAVDFPVLDLSDRLDKVAGPFMDTAAVIRAVDLVVTPDTAIAHLAGALGAPVSLALHFSADWRWLRQRDDSPWYPTLRLFRQTTFGQWPDVFERIANAVQARLSAAPPISTE